ncbi:MAG: sensor histidine kinase N-terminal domain-containing protein [Gammaproteobacteria bacterium]|nr:sensor histidine kinase N-terminal domain-containing protein [Gammaproteobacteria bacterium]
MNPSISRRLVFWLAMPLTLLALCGALARYWGVVAPRVASIDQRLRHEAVTLAERLRIERGRITVDGPAEAIRFAIRGADGRLIAGDPSLPPVALADEANAVYSTTRVSSRDLRMLTYRAATERGPLVISVAEDLGDTGPAARFGFMSGLLWDFLQLDLTLVLVWVGIRLGMRPIRRLRDELAERSPADLRPIPEASVPSELAPLTAALNRLFALLRGSIQSQQQFVANTAHQLRTPIAGMLAQLDLLVEEPAAQPVRARLTTLQHGIRQLAHAANQLLSLARADPAVNVALRRQPLDLAALAGEIVARHFDRALQAGIDLGAELAPARIDGDPSLLEDLLNNLVDNALRYTPASGRVTVSSGLEDGRPVVAVEDTGPGIPEAERQRVRQRHYRLPDSPGQGSGLGLAIVEEIAKLHDAVLRIDAGADGRGTRVSVQFAARAV